MSESLIDALKDLRESIPLDKLPTYDELLAMRGIYPARQQESEGVVVEITVEDHTVLLPPEIEDGKYRARLTRIQDDE